MPELYHFYTDAGEHWRYNDGKRTETLAFLDYAPQPISRTRWKRDLKDQSITLRVPLMLDPFNLFVTGNPATVLWGEILKTTSGTRIVAGKVVSVESIVADRIHEVRLMVSSRKLLSDVPARKFAPGCQWDLGDAGCGVVLNDFRKVFAVVGTISDHGLTVTHPDIGDEADGYWTRGYLQNGSERAFILSHVGNVLTLLNPFVRLTNANFELYPGCDKSTATCEAKFNQLSHFNGFPKVPRKNPVTEGF